MVMSQQGIIVLNQIWERFRSEYHSLNPGRNENDAERAFLYATCTGVEKKTCDFFKDFRDAIEKIR